MRKAWFSNTPLPDINFLVQSVQSLDCYRNLHNTKTAKQTIRKVISDWSNFKKALNAYKKDPSKFRANPRPPYYKKKLAQVIFYNETIKRKTLKNDLIIPTNGCFSIQSNRKFKEVVITPKTFGFIVDVLYEIEKPIRKKVKSTQHICCIDPGINNLCTITSDQLERPILINGRIAKSINQWYNKYPTKHNTKKRYFRLENYFHHVSKYIIVLCLQHNIDKIIIGKNDGWKQEVKLRKKTKQSFQYIPFGNLWQKLEYKAELAGVEIVYTNESYTSKCSFFDNEVMDHHAIYQGKRKYRGLFITKDGFAVNADVNGSLNIGRKVIGESMLPAWIADRSLAARPVIVNPLEKLTV